MATATQRRPGGWRGKLDIDGLDPAERILAAVILQAANDARSGDELQRSDAVGFLEWLGVIDKLHHPDRGGDLATMQQINQAYELLHSGQALLYASDPAAERYGAIEYDDADQYQRDRALGWADGQGGAYLYPKKALEAVRRLMGEDLNGVSKNTLYRQLERLKAIEPGAKDSTVVKRFGERPERYLHVLPHALRAGDDADA